MASNLLAESSNEIRANLVTTAVKFLSNPNVQGCTLESKERFLRSKGLTAAEIEKAIEKCSDILDVPLLTSELMFFHHSKKSWLRNRVLPVIIYGGLAYGCYWIYKNYLRRLLLVEKPKNKTTVECLDELRVSLDLINSSITSLRADLQTNSPHGSLRSQLDNLKADIATVKGILLNRNQFPALKTRTEPPSIPAWQRQSEESSAEVVEEKKKPHRSRSQRSESGGSNCSGSNSSEGEQTTKNSDSSLEIIT